MEYWIVSLVPLLVLADIVRGGYRFGFEGKRRKILGYMGKFGYGLLIGLMVSGFHWYALVCSVTWWLGEKTGWGAPIGYVLTRRESDSEWWQLPWMHKTYIGSVFSLFVRGIMWALPTIVILSYWQPLYLLTALMGIAFPIAFFIASRLPIQKTWMAGEVMRALFFGGLLCGGLYVFA